MSPPTVPSRPGRFTWGRGPDVFGWEPAAGGETRARGPVRVLGRVHLERDEPGGGVREVRPIGSGTRGGAEKRRDHGHRDARMADAEATRRDAARYDGALERYEAALMAQAKIYWPPDPTRMWRRSCRARSETCGEHECFSLNPRARGPLLGKLDATSTAMRGAVRADRAAEPGGRLDLRLRPRSCSRTCVACAMTSQNEEPDHHHAADRERRRRQRAAAARGSEASTCTVPRHRDARAKNPRVVGRPPAIKAWSCGREVRRDGHVVLRRAVRPLAAAEGMSKPASPSTTPPWTRSSRSSTRRRPWGGESSPASTAGKQGRGARTARAAGGRSRRRRGCSRRCSSS